MEIKSKSSLILSFALIGLALNSAGCSQTMLLSVKGQALLEDGQPIENGVIVISELHGKLLSMPSVTNTVETRTNAAGEFATELVYEGGDVNISLDAVPCKWNVAFVKFEADELKGVKVVTPTLVAKPAIGNSCSDKD